MTTIVNKYRLYCETESAYRYVWGEIEPTVCPSGTEHTIQQESVVIVDNIAEDHIEASIQEEEVPTGGHYQAKNVLMTISGGVEEHYSVSWPHPISLLSATYITQSGATGDEICACVGKDTIIGVVTATLSGSETEIPVSTSVVENVKIGYVVKLYDGVNEDMLGRVLAVKNSSIVVEIPVENSFSNSPTTYVRQTICLLDHGSPIIENQTTVLGSTKIGASYIPSGVNLTFHYKNNGSTTKQILIVLEYLY